MGTDSIRTVLTIRIVPIMPTLKYYPRANVQWPRTYKHQEEGYT